MPPSGLIQGGLAGLAALQGVLCRADLFNLSISAINAAALPAVGRLALPWLLFACVPGVASGQRTGVDLQWTISCLCSSCESSMV